jgi:hypothetical protein
MKPRLFTVIYRAGECNVYGIRAGAIAVREYGAVDASDALAQFRSQTVHATDTPLVIVRGGLGTIAAVLE